MACRGSVPSALPFFSLCERNYLGHSSFGWFRHMHPSKCQHSFDSQHIWEKEECLKNTSVVVFEVGMNFM